MMGIPLPIPRVVTYDDPVLVLPKKALRQRHRDELQLRQLLERVAAQQQQQQQQQETQNQQQTQQQQQDQQQQSVLGQELFQLVYGKGVTPQQREDFLVRYGCTGWTPDIIEYLVTIAAKRGIVEIGAGHGQWARALNDAYQQKQQQQHPHKKQQQSFDFVLAYDDQSNLPLNTHVYNPYTQPHHDYFGTVHRIQKDQQHLQQILQSWTCRHRVLLLVYPPPGPMAKTVLQTYINANTNTTINTNSNTTNAHTTTHDNVDDDVDIDDDDEADDDVDSSHKQQQQQQQQQLVVVYVGEGRGGANADDDFFDLLSNGEWTLQKQLPVQRPPGNKGYETLLVLQHRQHQQPQQERSIKAAATNNNSSREKKLVQSSNNSTTRLYGYNVNR
ncbi:hypothetical protein IV203_027155 [Nitzschia inconspicua]|uniref:Uncharacterized protein n=1 Tax=Nitzschia inconspicua TaxID=303405 RepID=A0A9K3Q0L9_9STRA|nr:hypothetical protein IV203_027155 [Nitzschia inconspicua]